MNLSLFHKIAFYSLVLLSVGACKSSALLIKEKKIDTIVAEYNSDSKPGASVLVYQNDKIVFKKGYGVKELTSFEKIEPFTNFRLASVTKQFTAMSILLLAKNNKISLESGLKETYNWILEQVVSRKNNNKFAKKY